MLNINQSLFFILNQPLYQWGFNNYIEGEFWLLIPSFYSFFFKWHCYFFLHWVMMSRALERVMASVNVARICLWNPDLTVFPSWSLGQWEMGRLWTQLPSKMQSSIYDHLLTRVVLSSMFHQGDGWLEASILPATSPSSWKEMPSSLELRSVFLYLLPMTLFCILVYVFFYPCFLYIAYYYCYCLLAR